MSGSRKPKLLGYFTLSGVSLKVERTAPVGAGQQGAPLTDGDFFASGEGATDPGDIVYELEDSIRNAHTDFQYFRATISASGVISFSVINPGETIVITWDINTALRDFLGFSGATTVITFGAPTSASQQVDISHWSPYGAQVDEPEDEVIQSTSKAIGGQIYAVTFGEHQYIEFGIQFPGWWRNSVDGKYRALRRLWRFHLLHRKRARYYLDTTATGPFDEDTNPYGYHEVQLAAGETSWKVRSINRQNRVRYEGRWRFAIYVA